MAIEAHAQHGAAHATHNRYAMNSVGLWLFFISECFLFAALFAGRFYLAGTDRPEHLNQDLGLAITAVLLASSFTAYLAETAMSSGKRGLCALFVLLTILLGVVFFAGVVIEWSEAEFSQSEPYGTAFFSMTGLHASHVLSGVGILSLLLLQLVRGRFTAEDHWGVEASIKYWHFVDVVWMFFYPALYLIG
ncbi:MAG: heme-copper oxidase subunit III [Dehalococcoidia bacterium]